MNLVTALAIVIGALAVVATYICLGLGTGLQIWALFIAWGSFFHTGGDNDALVKSLTAHVWGIIVATVALFVVGTVGGGALMASVIVGVSVVVLILGAHVPALGAIPAGVYGYASTAAFMLLTGVALTEMNALLSAAGIIAVSMILGGIFGIVSAKIAGALAK